MESKPVIGMFADLGKKGNVNNRGKIRYHYYIEIFMGQEEKPMIP